MVEFRTISVETFLSNYWQKKPLVIRKALPDFISPLSPDELAGLALEEEIESRIVCENPDSKNDWRLQRGPFSEEDFAKPPKTHWTLLVQGVDRFVPEVNALLSHFDFLPQWRFDDVMISFAAMHGGVGPHYDNYDVFLYQAKGRRKWLLTTQNCVQENYLPGLELRIMDEFVVEQEFILEEGDMLYLPPHVGHNGISLSDECMTYSFGYRAYSALEMLDSFGDYLSSHEGGTSLYVDPDWSQLQHNGVLNCESWQQARVLLQGLLDNEQSFKSWFAGFVSGVDRQAEELLGEMDPADKPRDVVTSHLGVGTSHLKDGIISRNPLCRFVCLPQENNSFAFYVNGEEWSCAQVPSELLILIASERFIDATLLQPFLNNTHAIEFLNKLISYDYLQI